MFPSRILIIEDNEDNLALMRLLLERAKYEVLTAVDGLSGIDLARAERPNLILLDLAMPEVDGWEVAQVLKDDILTRDIPIIAVTAHALPKDRARALEAGCDAFIVKPFSVSKLIGEIEQLLDW
ncbi:MAG TPA: response regulator [Chloroflexi bacterium]|nr:response regulator [Chloroflexota bacterium]HBY07574.1 response regulator [Chloroflexota bacterium]